MVTMSDIFGVALSATSVGAKHNPAENIINIYIGAHPESIEKFTIIVCFLRTFDY